MVGRKSFHNRSPIGVLTLKEIQFFAGKAVSVGSVPQSTTCDEVQFPRSSSFPVLPVPPDRDSYLVDPASSHMLVSKIKPCMSKYKQFIR